MARQFRTGDQTLVRELNRSIILNQLRAGASLSRADLAAISGLNKTTVSSLVEELLARNFVREIGLNASAGGRPAVLLKLNPEAGSVIGVEIGVGYLNVALADFAATIRWKRQVLFEDLADQRRVMSQVVAMIHQAIRHCEHAHVRVLGIGVSVPGLVDVESGTLVYAPNLGWRDAPMCQLLSAKFDLPIFVDNDANAATLGERYLGAAQRVDNFVCVVANVGLGVGIMLGGQLFQGASGYAGEAGHVTLDPDGPLCQCGNRGCWERFASQRALIERVRQASQAGPGSTALAQKPDQVTLQAILDAARMEDGVARRALEEIGEYLGIGIANLINVFNPSLVVFGGALSMADEFLTPVIQRTIAQRAMPGPREAAQFVVSTFKSDACVMGGVALVLHDILSHPRLDMALPSRQSMALTTEAPARLSAWPAATRA